jgi:hypothetical protein
MPEIEKMRKNGIFTPVTSKSVSRTVSLESLEIKLPEGVQSEQKYRGRA